MADPGNLDEAVGGASLTEAEYDVLSSLTALGDGWWRPMDFGGHDGSHHSATATRLARRGLVSRRDRGSLSRARAVWNYTITAQGRAALTVADTPHGKEIPGGAP